MTYEEQLGQEIEQLREIIRLQTEIIDNCATVESLLADLAWGEVICDDECCHEELPFDEDSGEDKE